MQVSNCLQIHCDTVICRRTKTLKWRPLNKDKKMLSRLKTKIGRRRRLWVTSSSVLNGLYVHKVRVPLIMKTFKFTFFGSIARQLDLRQRSCENCDGKSDQTWSCDSRELAIFNMRETCWYRTLGMGKIEEPRLSRFCPQLSTVDGGGVPIQLCVKGREEQPDRLDRTVDKIQLHYVLLICGET